MDLVVYDDDEKRYVPWAVALTAVLLVALLTAALTFLLARQASGDDTQQAVGGVGSPEPATAPTSQAPTATPSATPSAAPSSAAPTSAPPSPSPTAAPVVGPTQAPACVAALLQSDAALERAVTIDDLLAQHTAIMDELLAERIDAQEALDQALPVLTDGATERRRFEEAVADYRSSREECPT